MAAVSHERTHGKYVLYGLSAYSKGHLNFLETLENHFQYLKKLIN